MDQALRDEIAQKTYDVKFVEHGMDLRDGEEIADIVAPIVDRILAEQREAIAKAIEVERDEWREMQHYYFNVAAKIARDYGQTNR